MCAVVQNPLIGRAKQSVAGTIFSTWKGINVLRSKPITVANPKTPRQLLQRAKLQATVAMYRQIPGFIQLGYRQQAVKKSEYNAFSSDVLRNGFVGATVAALAFLPLDILLAKGTMAPTEFTFGDIPAGNQEIDWDSAAPLQPGQSNTDLFYAVQLGFSGDGVVESVRTSAAPVERSVGQILVIDAANQAAGTPFIYLFAVSQVDSGVSDSTVQEVGI